MVRKNLLGVARRFRQRRISGALNFPFLTEVSFLRLSTSKIEEVSQNCFVFDVSSSKIEEVSQNCFVLDVVKFKK